MTYTPRITTTSQPDALAENAKHLKQNISNVLKYVDENYHPKNLTEYNKVLSQFNVVCKPCSKGEDPYGKGYSGCQFSVLNGDDEAVSHLIKGSAFGKKYSYQALEQKFAYNSGNEDLRKVDGISKDYIRTAIDNYINAPTKKDFDGLIQHLGEKGITVNKVADLDDNTKIKGVSFIDNVNGNTYNGSQLGKAYSYSRICDSIEKKNAEIDKQENNSVERIYLPKDIYVSGMKILNATFNKERKDQDKYGCYFECDAIRKLEDFRQVLGEKVTAELNLNPKQTDKLFDCFKQNKLADLPNVELRESVGQKNNIVMAVQFAQYIPNPQLRANFFEQMGIKATATDEFEWKFSSSRMPNVNLTSAEIIEMTKDSNMPVLDKNMLYADDGKEPLEVEPLTKEERSFIKDFVDGKEIKHVASSVCNLVETLDDKFAEPLLNKVYVPSDTKDKVNDSLYNIMSAIVKEQYDYSTLSFINNIRSHHLELHSTALRACGNDDFIAAKMVSDFKKRLEDSKPALVEKENGISKERIVHAVQFAANNIDTVKQSEFFARMGVVVGHDKMGNFEFSTVRNPQYKMSVKELRESCSKLPSLLSCRLECTKTEHLKQVEEGSLYKFSTKAFNQVKLFNEGNLNNNNYEFKNATALAYVRDFDSHEIKQMDIRARMHDVIDRNPDASIGAVVKALNCRGFIIKPADSMGSSFKIGMHDSDEDDFIPMPKDLSDRLSRSNYMAVKDNIDTLLHNRNFLNGKTWLLMDITRAADYNSPARLDKVIDKVRLQNNGLADAMVKAKGTGSTPDYERVATLVYEYRGERTIILPPPTIKKDSFVVPVEHRDKDVNASTYQSIQEVLRNGTFLDYIFQKARERLSEKTSQQQSGVKAFEQVHKPEFFKGSSTDGKPDFDGLCEKFNIKLSDADKTNLTKFGIMSHTVHTFIDGERDLVIAYDKTTNQFALANPKSFVFDKSHVDGMSDDVYTDLMKKGSVIFKDFKHSDGRTNDALLYLNPFKMKVYVKNEIPKFEVNPKVVTSVDMKMDGRNLNADPFMKPPVDNEQKQSRGFKHRR